MASATGGTVVEQTLGTPYIANTIFIAVLIFFLTIFGASTVRKAATVMAVLIIGGMLTIYTSNLVVNFGALSAVVAQAPNPKGFWPALWQAAKYGGLQCSLIGKGYAWIGMFSTPLVVVPILLFAAKHRVAAKAAKGVPLAQPAPEAE